MNKHWFLIESLEMTIDLSQITTIAWNKKVGQKIFTFASLGNDVVFNPNLGFVVGNDIWIEDMTDRRAFLAALKFMGVPSVALKSSDFKDSSNEKTTTATEITLTMKDLSTKCVAITVRKPPRIIRWEGRYFYQIGETHYEEVSGEDLGNIKVS